MAEVAVDVMDVVDAVVAQIVSATSLNPNYVYTAADENEDPPVKKNVQIVTVSLGSFLPDVGQQTGGMAFGQVFNNTWKTVLVVNCWIALMTDPVGQNNQWLRNATRGTLPLFKKVWAGLEGFFPLLGGNQMFGQPMRLSPGGFTILPGSAGPKIARLRAEFEAEFIPKLT